jgi:predicted lipoprotein
MRPVLLASVLLAACGGGSSSSDGFDDREVVVAFADDVAVATYVELAERAAELDAAVAALAADPSDANLDAAQAAWVATREPWEQSEGFLFGPVDSFGFDPALDSWPVNQNDLEAVLASDDELTEEYVRNLGETQKGFHTIEYLLFGEDSAKVAADLTARELEYLAALSDESSRITGQLALAWTDGIEGAGPFRDVIATAGEDGNTAYPSLAAAAQQMIDGMVGICDEVANGKIADPHDQRDPDLVESQFSFNSELDFTDNLIGVRNVWQGDSDAAGTDGPGLREWVAERDAALADRLDAEIEAAIAALAAMPDPFRDAIQDPAADATIRAAQDAIRTVQATLEGDVTAVVLP